MQNQKEQTNSVKPAPGVSGKKIEDIDPIKLNLALRDVEDLLGRMLVPFVVLQETAAQIVKGEDLKGHRVCVGVERKHLTKEALSTMNTIAKDLIITKKGYKMLSNGIPIYITVIEKKWKFLKNKDFKFHFAGEYYIPNPFKDYWKVRHFLR